LFNFNHLICRSGAPKGAWRRAAAISAALKRLLTPLFQLDVKGPHGMKINGPSSTTPVSRKREASRTSGASFEPAAGAAAKATGVSGATGPMGVGSIDALLALQGETADDILRRKAAGRAFNLLDLLDDIKIALLEGGVPRSKLNALLGALNVQRDETRDERLESVLDEVETRAMVELAKYDRAA
jgi:hypothetical protein